MNPLIDDTDFTLYVGDVLDVLASLPDESVHCVVTSPPYWGLRDYGTGSWDGGNADCDHKVPLGDGGSGQAADGFSVGFRTGKQYTGQSDQRVSRDVCGKCGARRVDKQLGLEPTPDEYVANMVGVFREVRRVLRRDGTCWLNIGDSYASGTGGPQGANGEFGGNHKLRDQKARGPIAPGMKPKDLVGIPWRLAFALQADGWYLRSDIIWSKPNPMPESVTDRPTKAHEYLFLLTRSPRYFYDADAIRQDSLRAGEIPGGNDGRAAGEFGVKPHGPFNGVVPAGRNRRSVWEIATEPYPDAHFATFPQALVEPCVLAGTSEKGCCPVCGAPWERETTSEVVGVARNEQGAYAKHDGADGTNHYLSKTAVHGTRVSTTTGWRPPCDHNYDRNPPTACVVLDPFMGSGTTAVVARRLGRRSIGIELNAEYAQLIIERTKQLSLLA